MMARGGSGSDVLAEPEETEMNESVVPRSLRVNGVELAYLEQGQGDAVVIVNGSVNHLRSLPRQHDPF
jgi:hypothetical protein